VVQPIRGEGKGKLVAYSLGNLISNQRDRYRDGGIAFEVELVKGPEGAKITGHAYLPIWVYKPLTKKGTLFTLMPASIDPASLPENPMSKEDISKMSQFLEDTRTNLFGNREVEPYWLE